MLHVDTNSSTSSSLLTEFGNNMSFEAKEEGKIALQLLKRACRDCKCALDRIKNVNTNVNVNNNKDLESVSVLFAFCV